MKNYITFFIIVLSLVLLTNLFSMIHATETIKVYVPLGVKVCTTFHAITAECDSTPDIGAGGRVAVGGNPTGNWAASNELPFGTKLVIPAISGKTIWTVRDRLNAKYPHRVDLLMPLKVKGFGLKRAEVFIYVEVKK